MKMFTNEPLNDQKRSGTRLDYSEEGSSLNDREEVNFDLTRTGNSKMVSFKKEGGKGKTSKNKL